MLCERVVQKQVRIQANKLELRLAQVLEAIESFRALAYLPCPIPKGVKRQATVRLVGSVAMVKLNSKYRGKNTKTDILSFPTPQIFQKAGVLGELVICWPVLQAQAREFRHSNSVELDILLIHGSLHLLGMDHENSQKEALEMAKWEGKVLKKLWGGGGLSRQKKGLSLIERAHSGIKTK
ncbi:MAG: rRNA maturation RNase YbeY [Bdellovibrio sp.]|nr:rRNA maturation RNase YbeY [Bdellovibrio sp.]